MLTMRTEINRFPGAVPAVLSWAGGDTERLAELVECFCAQTRVLSLSLSRDLKAKDALALRRDARRLYEMLGTYGVPGLRTAAATLEDLGRTNDLGQATALVEELDAALGSFCAYLAQKPWLRY